MVAEDPAVVVADEQGCRTREMLTAATTATNGRRRADQCGRRNGFHPSWIIVHFGRGGTLLPVNPLLIMDARMVQKRASVRIRRWGR